MNSNQKVFITIFLAGMAAFFAAGIHVLSNHNSWNDFASPTGVSDLFIIGLAVVTAIGGALGIDVSSLIKTVKGNKID